MFKEIEHNHSLLFKKSEFILELICLNQRALSSAANVRDDRNFANSTCLRKRGFIIHIFLRRSNHAKSLNLLHVFK